MSDLVTVIINVYNCKEYLPYSLESVRQQTYKNLEVILVDDASTDGSGEFCDEFCKQDERFRVIHHEKNTGVSGPRNTGLREAKGDYIYFMDSDDYIHVEAIEALVGAIKETGLELAAFDFYWHADLNGDTHYQREKKPIEIIPSEQMIFEMLSRVELKWCVVWNKLYKKSLLDGLFFNDYYCIQDQDYNIRVYQRIEKAALIPEELYWYVLNPGSLQGNPAFVAKKLYFNTLNRFKILDSIVPDNNEIKYRAWIIGYGYLQMPIRRIIEKGTEYEDVYRKLCKETIKKTIEEFLTTKHFPVRKKIKFIFSWYFPFSYKLFKKIKVWLYNSFA